MQKVKKVLESGVQGTRSRRWCRTGCKVQSTEQEARRAGAWGQSAAHEDSADALVGACRTGSSSAGEQGAHGVGLRHGSAAQGQGTPWPPWGWVRACRLGQLTQSGVRVGTHHCAVGPWCPHESQLGLALGVAQLLPIAPPRLSSGLAPAAPCSLIAAAQPADLALNPSACNRLCSPEPGQAARGPVPAVAPCLCCAEPVLPFCATLCVPWCAVPRSVYHALP